MFKNHNWNFSLNRKLLEYSFFGPEIKLERPKLCVFLPGKVATIYFRPRGLLLHISLFRGPTKFKTSKAQSEIIIKLMFMTVKLKISFTRQLSNVNLGRLLGMGGSIKTVSVHFLTNQFTICFGKLWWSRLKANADRHNHVQHVISL